MHYIDDRADALIVMLTMMVIPSNVTHEADDLGLNYCLQLVGTG